MTCQDCSRSDAVVDLSMVVADLGQGAFLAVLCGVCWHRRKYRAELEKRKADRALIASPVGPSATRTPLP